MSSSFLRLLFAPGAVEAAAAGPPICDYFISMRNCWQYDKFNLP